MKKNPLQKSLIDDCYRGDRRKVTLCLQSGASPNAPDERSYYPLHMACQEGHFNVVDLLVRSGANPNLKDNDGKGETALFRAVGAGHLRIVKYLIRSGSNVNLRRGGRSGDTPLHIACSWGRYNEAVELVNAGANINAFDDEKHDPIYHAVANGHSNIVALLIEHGALATSKIASKKTLLDTATANQDKETVRLLELNLTRQP